MKQQHPCANLEARPWIPQLCTTQGMQKLRKLRQAENFDGFSNKFLDNFLCLACSCLCPICVGWTGDVSPWFFADALWRANLSKFQKKSKGLDLLWFTIAVSLSSVACSWVWSSTNSFDIGPLSTWECTESDTHALFSTAQSYHPLDPLGRSEVCPHLRLNRLGCNLLLSHYLACAHPHRKMIGNTAETGKFRVSEKWDRSRMIKGHFSVWLDD